MFRDMTIANLEFIPASIPYTHREVSSQVRRDGVSDIIVKATTADGLTGWGESCSGAGLASVLAALEAMKPFVLGRSAWESEGHKEVSHGTRTNGIEHGHDGTDGAVWYGREMPRHP